MTTRFTRSLLTVMVMVTAVFALVAAPVSARPERFSFDYEETTIDSSCGISVERHDVGKGKGLSLPKQFYITNTGITTITNPANGKFVTEKYSILFKNFNFVENPDGTQSSNQTQIGPWTMYSSTGKVLLRARGPITYYIVIDPNGTTDETFFLVREIVFELGTHHDQATYCSKLVAAIG